jgi:hypothetical protein
MRRRTGRIRVRWCSSWISPGLVLTFQSTPVRFARLHFPERVGDTITNRATTNSHCCRSNRFVNTRQWRETTQILAHSQFSAVLRFLKSNLLVHMIYKLLWDDRDSPLGLWSGKPLRHCSEGWCWCAGRLSFTKLRVSRHKFNRRVIGAFLATRRIRVL